MHNYGLGDALEAAMTESGYEASDGYFSGGKVYFDDIVSNFMNSPEFLTWLDTYGAGVW